ncbi:MAG: hypothetical protein IPF99_33755 [Deltaproteobacteria bacterium]|nr:hypothetical protein [Deltaproteobacteria bacterium]
MKSALIFGLFSLLLSGCANTINGVITSDERRIWVVRNQSEVFRCADGSGEGEPPRPVCVRAPLVSTPGQ